MKNQSDPIIPLTGPDDHPGYPKIQSREIQSAEIGVPTKYWLELVSYPTGSTRSLWFYVNGEWVSLDDPDEGTQDIVFRIFNDPEEKNDIKVWYNSSKVVGLVVSSKE